MLNVKVGDTVTIYTGGQRGTAHQHTVERTGRKYFYVKMYGQEVGFSLETGVKQNDVTGYRTVAKTQAQVDEARRRQEAVDVMKAHGVTLAWDRNGHLTTEQLEALADVAKTFPTI